MDEMFIATHTQSVHHIEERVGGWYDTALTERGRRDASRLACAIARRVDPATTLLVASDLLRAQETARIVGAALGLQVLLDPRLREFSFGTAEGKPQRWLDERIVYPPATGPRLDHVVCEGAETRRDCATRIYQAMIALEARPERTAVVVTHGFAMTFVVAWWLGIPVDHVGFVSIRSDAGGITHLRRGPPFWNRSLESVNDMQHLESCRWDLPTGPALETSITPTSPSTVPTEPAVDTSGTTVSRRHSGG